jgi:hypothetical protein
MLSVEALVLDICLSLSHLESSRTVIRAFSSIYTGFAHGLLGVFGFRIPGPQAVKDIPQEL